MIESGGPDEESQVAFAQMTAQAQQAMGEKQQEARARAQQFQAGLVNQFREAAKPLVEEIARLQPDWTSESS